MEYLLDFILLAIFALMLYSGVKRGFVHTVISAVAVFAAMLLASALSKTAAPWLYVTFVQETATQAVAASLPPGVDITLSVEQAKQVMQELPEVWSALAATVGIDLNEVIASIGGGAPQATDVAARVAEWILRPIAEAVLRVVAFAVCMIVLYILIRILMLILDRVFKLPVLKSANKLLGALLGAVKGILFLLLICTVLQVVAGFMEDSAFAEAVAASRLVQLLNLTKAIGAANPVVLWYN